MQAIYHGIMRFSRYWMSSHKVDYCKRMDSTGHFTGIKWKPQLWRNSDFLKFNYRF